MGLAVIGAGFGRTGTDSMRAALDMLGLGPCHHMRETFAHPEQERLWRSISHGARPDWDDVFRGYGSAIDWPSAYYWRELGEHFPDAKILLTVRSAESWFASMENTIIPYLTDRDPDSIGNTLIRKLTFDNRMHDRAYAMAVFEKNIADVRAAFAEDRLLTFHVGDGWDPLCNFLGKQIPEEPFPRMNAAGDEFETLSAPKFD